MQTIIYNYRVADSLVLVSVDKTLHSSLFLPSSQYVVDAAQLVWNTNLLRAFLQAFFAIHTLVGAIAWRLKMASLHSIASISQAYRNLIRKL